MPLRPPAWSFGADERGEAALIHLPEPMTTSEPVLLFAGALTAFDTWTAVSLRASVSYVAEHHDESFTIEPPADQQVWAHLVGHLGPLPEKCFAAEKRALPTPIRSGVILPTMVLQDHNDLQAAADTVSVLASGFGRSIARTVAIALSVFADNTLVHSNSPIGAVAGISYSPHSDELSVIVIDLGSAFYESATAEADLAAAWTSSTARFASFAGLVDRVARRNLDGELILAAGRARLRWRNGDVSAEGALDIPGFASGLVLRGVRS